VQGQKEQEVRTHPVENASHGPRFRLGKRTFTLVCITVDLAGSAVPEDVVISVAISAHKFGGLVWPAVFAPLGILTMKLENVMNRNWLIW